MTERRPDGEARLSHLFVHLPDLAPVRRFYEQAIGLPLTRDPGGHIRIGDPSGFHLGAEVVADFPETDETELVIQVSDVDAVYERLIHAGAVVDEPPQDMPWGLRQCWTRDPNGLRVSIASPISQPSGTP
jgi:predicted enzyme related to lactoylglutathione lyase